MWVVLLNSNFVGSSRVEGVKREGVDFVKLIASIDWDQKVEVWRVEMVLAR
jgi:hypothetical protein